MLHLINYFPREVGIPYRLQIKNKEEFLKLVNQSNGIKTVYYSLYEYPYEQCKIDKIHFDLDKEDALTSIKILHDYCKFENLKHLMLFSGRRYQFYIMACNYENINNKKDCLKNAQHFIVKACNLTIGEPNKCDIDFHLIGDTARLVRVPNTMHLATKLYAIPLTEEDIGKGEDFIKTKAKQQEFKFVYYGDKLFDIKKYDYENFNNIIKIELNREMKEKIEGDKVLNLLPKCLANILLSDYISWRNCFRIVVYLRDRGYSAEYSDTLLERYLKGKKTTDSQDIYMKRIVKERMVERIYTASNYFFSCRQIKEEGYCINGCREKIYI